MRFVEYTRKNEMKGTKGVIWLNANGVENLDYS
jgi:hypothetical protein